MAAAITATDLVKVFGRGAAQVRALDGVNVAFGRARLTAIVGPSGSGKSTLMQCLAGLDTPTSGRVLLGDVDVTALSDRRLTRLRLDHVGFVFQSFNLLPQLTARENILLPAGLAERTVDKDRFRDLVDMLGIADRLRHLPSELSGGQQQRVAIARAMLGRPEAIFADEPTGNLDSASSEQVLELLRTAVRDFGQTTVMVTHDQIAASFADQVITMADGQVAA
jgi:putative ABC transport system ATP-binding protein